MKKSKLFYRIARLAIAAGREISLTDEDVQYKGKALGGTILDSSTDTSRVILRVYAPGEEAEDDV